MLLSVIYLIFCVLVERFIVGIDEDWRMSRHGVKQRRNPWSDGPVYITQCPIKPGSSQTYTIVLSDEEGTVWWHAHNDWARATVHGAFIVYPRRHGKGYPFLKPHKEIPIILGQALRLASLEKAGVFHADRCKN